MRILRWLPVILAVGIAPACAQSNSPSLANVVTTCGTASYSSGTTRPLTQDATGAQCSAATFSGSVTANSAATATAAAPSYPEGTSQPLSQTLTGDLRVTAKQSDTWSVGLLGFPGGATTNGTPMSVTTSSSAQSLPAGTSVNVFNTGSNTAFVQLGATATTSGIPIPANSGCVLNVGSATQIAAITSTSTTSLNLNGGSNFGSFCYGGGGSSGAGSSVNLTGINGVTPSVGNGTTDTGTIRATLSSDGTGVITAKQGTAANLNATVVGTGTLAVQNTAATPAGTNIIGKVGIDQTTPGTTNGVVVNSSALPTGAATSALQPTNAAQGSTTSGQTGRLTMGAVTTSAPTYTTGQTSPMSLDTTGALRVNVTAGGGTGGTSVAQGSTTSGQNVSPAGCATVSSSPTNTNAQTNMVTCDTSGNLNVNVKSATGVAQGSTTSGQSISPIGCRTLSSAPTDSTAQTNMPWCKTDGSLAVTVVSGGGTGGTSSNFGSAFPSAGTATGVQNSSGNMVGGIQADQSVALNVSTATTTQLVALSSGKKIYVTSFDVIAGGTGNITFEYGTGTNCGTGTTVLTGAYPLTAQVGIAKGNGMGTVLVVPASNALCVLTSAAVQMSGSVSYVQY